MCQEGNGSLRMMNMRQFKQTHSEVKKLIKSKETAFQERQTEQTKGLCLLPRKESFLTPRFPLPLGFLLTLRSVLGSDPSMLKIDCLILRKTHQGHYNTPTHRGRISTGTKHNPPRPRTQQGFWMASGKSSPHASCSGVSPDILPSMTGHKTMCGVGAGT